MIEDVLNEDNIKLAYEHLKEKKNTQGKDGVFLYDVLDYYELNKESITKSIYNKKYKCKTTLLSEMLNYKGKKRIIAMMSSIDRLLARSLYQVIEPEIQPLFSSYSYAYQDNKGVEKAIKQIQEYAKENSYVCSIDIENFFDEIDHEIMLKEINKLIKDHIVVYLLNEFIRCEVEFDYLVAVKNKGLIQGNSLSPILSNLYLDSFDKHLECKEVKFVRFADDIYLFFTNKEDAYRYMNHVKQILEARYHLHINKSKSGIHEVDENNYLGYELHKDKNKVEVIKKFRYQPEYRSTWFSSNLRYMNHQYHLMNDGILSRKDYSLLFENEDKKVDLPVEVVDHINIHSNIIFASSILEIMNKKKINIKFFDKYGNFIGEFIPNWSKNVNTTLNQANIYNNTIERLKVAKAFVIASIHNERANIKYYNKHIHKEELEVLIDLLINDAKEANECKSYEELLLIEARAKRTYYSSFNYFLSNDNFTFTQRSKQPPLDPINAMISFGNTVLYNIIATEMYKTTLDIRIGYQHASNNRKQSLNLDLADVFKPIVIDRVIFTMINKKIISSKHFEAKNNGIYLTNTGKKLFIEQINKKLYDHITYDNEKKTYYSVIRSNIYSLLQFFNEGKKLKLYKYQ